MVTWWQRRKRRAAERYARRYGYFWLPCPLCRIEFGGHEWLRGFTDETGKWWPAHIPGPEGRPGMCIGICPTCTRDKKGCYWGKKIS